MRQFTQDPALKKSPEHYQRVNNEAVPLVMAAQHGDRTAEADVMRRFQQVAFFAAKRWGRVLSSEDVDDLATVGLRGVWRAIQTYDPDQGMSFLSWAVQWSISYVQRQAYFLLARGGIARNTPKWTRALTFMLDGGREGDVEELAARMHVDRAEAMSYMLGWHPTSLDTVASDNHVGAKHRDPDPERLCMELEMVRGVEVAIAKLGPREVDILRRRSEDETLEDIGKSYGLTRERVRQLESIAIGKLRHILKVEGCKPGTRKIYRPSSRRRARAVVRGKTTEVRRSARHGSDAGPMP